MVKDSFFIPAEMQQPFELYDIMLHTHPVFRNEQHNLWIVYSYENCSTILHHKEMEIPPVSGEGLNEHALLLSQHLVRLSNEPNHHLLKSIAHSLAHTMQPVDMNKILNSLLNSHTNIDWCEISKQIPLLYIGKALNFNEEQCKSIASLMPGFVPVMQGYKNESQLGSINKSATVLYPIFSEYLYNNEGLFSSLNTQPHLSHLQEDVLSNIIISNICGLFIQSYDAVRGLLSNAMLHFIHHPSHRTLNTFELNKIITEIARFTPPIHNTRRIAGADIMLNDIKINKGDIVIIMLAAANRDPAIFEAPQYLNANRPSNFRLLSFGTGMHACIAQHVSVDLTVQVMKYLFSHYSIIQPEFTEISHEYSTNARIPSTMMITLLS